MPIVWDSVVPPAALTEFVRNVPQNTEYTLDTLFPRENIDDIEVTVDEVTITTRAAKVRAWDAPPAPGKRDDFTTKKMKLLPVSQMLGRGERDRLNIELLRTRGRNTEAIRKAILDDAENNTRSVLARLELARGDVLADGKLTIAENGVVAEADFAVPGGHIVTAATLWTNAAADIVGDLQAWTKTYRTTNGFAPGGMAMSEDTVYNMFKNTAIRNLFTTSTGAPSTLNQAALDQVLRDYRLPPIALVYDAQVDIDGSVTSILPSNKLFLLPPGLAVGKTYFGLSATALELASAGVLSFASAPGLVGVIDKDARPPYRETTYVDGTFLTALTAPKRLFIATVG